MALSNAGSTVSNAFVTQFADDVIHAAQQKTSKRFPGTISANQTKRTGSFIRCSPTNTRDT